MGLIAVRTPAAGASSLKTFPALALLLAMGLGLSACSGGGGGGGGDAPAPASSPTPGSGSTTTASAIPALPSNNAMIDRCPTLPAPGTGVAPVAALSGRITFDRIPFFPAPTTPYATLAPGLNYAAPEVTPARGVVVEAVAASGSVCEGNVLATTLTDGDGWYGLDVPLDQAVCVRARAQLYRSAAGGPGWDIAVVDNTDNNRLYAMADSRFTSARSAPQRHLHAASGWAGSGYTGPRVAAPFAILDTACKSANAILDVQPTAQFGAMTFRWSTRNTESSSGALTDGKIGGAFFSEGSRAVYLRGDAQTNTDEFDEMVIAHEFAHFVTYQFARTDSVGGDHSLQDRLDPTIAFDEGWATAFAGLTLGSPVYRDSDEIATASAPSREYYFFINDATVWRRSWYGEASVQSLIYAFGETAASDGVSLGFGPIWQLFTGPYKQEAALQTIFSFAAALKAAYPTSASAIASLLNDEQISGDAIEPFAQTETHAPDTARDLPVYTPLDTATVQRVCSRNQYASPQMPDAGPNRLSQIRYLHFTPPQSGHYRITATPVRTDTVKGGLVGLELQDAGAYFACSGGSSNLESLEPGCAKSLSCPLGARTYVVAVYQTDFANDPDAAASNYDQCFDVKAEPL